MSTPEQRPAAPVRPSRRVPLLGWVGLSALVASFAIAAGLPGWSHAAKPTPPSSETSAATPPAARSSAGKATCFGFVDVEKGVAPLYPVQPGRVVDVIVKEGAKVEAGAPLFRVDDSLAKIRLQDAKTALSAAQMQLEQARGLPARHKAKITAQEALIEVARQDVEAAREQHEKARNFYDKKIGGSEEDVKAAAALVRKAEAALKAREAELVALNSVDPRISVSLAEQDVIAKKADVEKAELGVKECTVSAPSRGSVLRLSVSAGEVLGPSPRQPALMFCPDAPRIVRAEVEQEFADQIAVGQTASIQDDATSAGTWTGKVARLSDWYTHRRSVLLEPMQYNDVRTLECIIELPPGQAPLRIGQRVRVMLGGLEP